jgi:hypothetical protein
MVERTGAGHDAEGITDKAMVGRIMCFMCGQSRRQPVAFSGPDAPSAAACPSSTEKMMTEHDRQPEMRHAHADQGDRGDEPVDDP